MQNYYQHLITNEANHINRQPSTWIDNSIEKPQTNGQYLAFYNEVFIGRYTQSTKQWKKENLEDQVQPVTHWMPLPLKP